MSHRNLFIVSVLLAIFSMAAKSPEENLVEILPKLHPISDSQWNELIGPKVGDVYEVQRGDYLWAISKTLFGNPFYWPKVWAINHKGISNPHAIEPGQKLAFNSGSSEAFPSLSDGQGGNLLAEAKGVSSVTAHQGRHKKGPLHEYDKVAMDAFSPDDWGNFQERDDALVDDDLRILLDQKLAYRVPALVNDNTLPYLGEITGSRRDGTYIAEHDVVFIQSNGQELQVGSFYSVFSNEEKVSHKKSDRTGYSYTSNAEVRVIGVKDSLYIAEVTKAVDVIRRGDRIYPLLPLINSIKPVESRTAVEGLVLMDPLHMGANSSQFRYIYFDRGIEDGVEIGNVFRIYDYTDPSTGKRITDSDFLVSADAIVIHATAQFSTALILRSRSTVVKGDLGVLLTDLTEMQRPGRKIKDSFSPQKQNESDHELDELDELDRKSGEGLGTTEEQEIKELDHWDKSGDRGQEKNLEATPLSPDSSAMEPPAGSDVNAVGNSTEPLEPLDALPSSAPVPSEPQNALPPEDNAVLDGTTPTSLNPQAPAPNSQPSPSTPVLGDPNFESPEVPPSP